MIEKRPIKSRLFIYLLILLVVLNLFLLLATRWPGFLVVNTPTITVQPSAPPVTVTVTPSPQAAAPAGPLAALIGSQTPLPTLAPDAPAIQGLRQQGVMIMALPDGAYTHLFAYHPQYLGLTRLTNQPWDDIAPAVSPDGTQLAYASRQNGYWDLYIMDLATGKQTRVTDTAEYDSAPSWSPDSLWLTYESYVDGNLEIFIQSIRDLNQAPIRLTNDPAADYAPVWSPAGQEIAFISTRSGNQEIWLARLQRIDDRFINVTQRRDSSEDHPAWDASGKFLAYASNNKGISEIYVWDTQRPPQSAYRIGNGSWPVWSPIGNLLLTEVRGANQTDLTAYQLANNMLAMPFTTLPSGKLEGITWRGGEVVQRMDATLRAPDLATAQPLSQPTLSLFPMNPVGRFGVLPLPDVNAGNPYLHDAVDEAFNALRRYTATAAGWDFLGNLDEAYLPLTEPPPPGGQLNWLYTGRAFAASSAPLQAGWMVVVREDIGGQTYWRLYLRARYQDGSQGQPLHQQPWDLQARFGSDTVAYEQGGRLAAIPDGYWIDFTDLANRLGWERVPGLSNWRTYFPAARFNQFVITDGLDWYTAMSELYPPEAMATATSRPTRTRTPTQTPETEDNGTEQPTQTPSITPTITLTPTLRPTWTPAPTR